MRPTVTEHVPLHSKLLCNVKILHVRLGVANNMRPLSWGGGKNGKDPKLEQNNLRRKTTSFFTAFSVSA